MALIIGLSWIYKFRQQDSFYKEKGEHHEKQ